MLSNNKSSFLYSKQIPITDKIKIKIPTIGEIFEIGDGCDDKYYSLVNQICANPRDFAVPLDDVGLKYTKIKRYELFNIFFKLFVVNNTDLSTIFVNLDINKLKNIVDKNEQVIWVDENNEVVINEIIYSQIEDTLRKMTGLVRDDGRAGNNLQYEKEIEKKRKQIGKRSKKLEVSYLERQIIAMVNSRDFPYNYESVKDITLYQLNKSVSQILHSKEVDYIKQSAYVGMIDITKIAKEDLSLIPMK